MKRLTKAEDGVTRWQSGCLVNVFRLEQETLCSL